MKKNCSVFSEICLNYMINLEINEWIRCYINLSIVKKICAYCHTVSRSTWITTQINGVATDLFCTGVIDHPGCMFLN